MRIAFISYEYPPDTAEGGIATYVVQAARALQRRGHAVEVFAGSRERFGVEIEEGVTIHRLQTASRDDFTVTVGPLFADRQRTAPFDVLEGPDFRAEARVAARLAPAVPLVVRMHTPQFLVHRVRDAYLLPTERARLSRQAARRGTTPRWNPFCPLHDAERLHLLEADEIVGISASITETLTRLWRLPPDRIVRIPNPYSPAPALLEIPLDTRTRTVTFLGRIEMRKGAIELAKAIPFVLRQHPEVTFRFVGKSVPIPRGMPHAGKDTSAWILAHLRSHREALEFTGPIAHDRIPEMLARTDLCVFPSLWENFPYVCLEAMAAGRGVVGSREGGMREMLAEEAGLTVHPDNPHEIAAAILRLLDDPALRIRYGQRARERVQAEYAPDRIAALQEQSYLRAIERRHALGPRKG